MSVVAVRLPGGGAVELSALALRDACTCSECRHPVSGQRLFESRDVVRAAALADVREVDGGLAVRWQDGHETVFPESWLRAEAAAVQSGSRPRRGVTPWRRGDFELEPLAWEEIVASPAIEQRWLAEVATRGFSLVSGVPCEPAMVAEVAARFGPLHETNYGRVFDVSVRVDATNLADTALPLSVHTDNPYRRPQPTIQLLHCLTSTAIGGDSVLVDGLLAVERLRAADPAAVETLAATPVRFAYRDDYADLECDAPVLDLGVDGTTVSLRVNNRSKGIPAARAAKADAWYAAYFALLDLLAAPDAELVFRLGPGDLMIFDNERVLHGRTGFEGGGERRLQGCYAHRDALLSKLALLERVAG